MNIYKYLLKLLNKKKNKKIRNAQQSEISVLCRLKNRNLDINSLVDIGASDGRWSRTFGKIYKDSAFLLIEANKNHLNGLKQFKQDFENSNYELTAAGAHDGDIYFLTSPDDDFAGVATYEKPENEHSKSTVNKIDTLVNKHGLKPPYAIKFDTHGFELEILKGCEETLKNTNLIIMECYNFKISDDSLLFYDMCKHLETMGFRPIDMSGIMHRDYDKSLWQMDFYFIKDHRNEFKHKGYS